MVSSFKIELTILEVFENKKFTQIGDKIHTTDLEELEKQVKYYKKINRNG